MHFGIPILAYDSSAIADTLGGSGVLFDEKDFARTAEMMNVIVSGGELKERIVQGQRERLKRFDRGNIEKELLAALGPLLN